MSKATSRTTSGPRRDPTLGRGARRASRDREEHGVRRRAGRAAVDFSEPEDSLEEISWDDFFAKFDEEGLALVYQDETKDGSESRFFKLVKR